MTSTRYQIYQDIYAEHLSNIKGVKFTRREIDLIAFMTSGRSAKKTADFLSLSPKTVENYTRNIMIKLNCNSKESIISFIEDSEKFSYVKEHYTLLLKDAAFEKCLKDISFLKGKGGPAGLIVFWQSDQSPRFLIDRLIFHLNLAGITTTLELREEISTVIQLTEEVQPNLYVIYALPLLLIEQLHKQLQSQETKTLQASGKIPQISRNTLFVFLEDSAFIKTNQDLKELNHINLADQKSYYGMTFELLKKILPHLKLEEIIEEFEAKENAFSNFPNKSPGINLEEELPKIRKDGGNFEIRNLWKNKKASIATICLCLSAVIFGLLPFTEREGGNENAYPFPRQEQGSQENPLNPSIRSDLLIPAETVLLDRSELVSQMANQFKAQHKSIQTIALVGIGGAGKTTLARQYARSQALSVVWEINAETPASLRSSFESLADSFSQTDEEKKALRELHDIKNSEEREKKIIQLVKGYLRAQPGWLLIYDNVKHFNSVQKYFPSDPQVWGKGKVILTTQDSHIQTNNHIHSTIQVGELNNEEKLKLFCRIMDKDQISSLSELEGSKQTDHIKEFLNTIPPFPLDISTAAYYLKATNISYTEYVNYLTTNDNEFIEIQENVLKASTEYSKTRYRIVSLSLKDLIHNQKDFADLLLLVSLLDSQSIPRDLLDRYKDRLVVDNFIYNLKKYSLIANPLSNSIPRLSHLFIHLSIQDISLAYLKEFLNLDKNSILLKRIIFILDDYLDHIIEQEDFGKMQTMARHLEKLLTRSNLLTDFSKGLLASKLGCIYYFLNNDKALEIIKDSLKDIRRESLKTLSSEDEIRVARSLLHIGATYTELRSYKEAQELLERAVKIYRKDRLRNEIELSWALSHLGDLHRREGNYEKSRDCLEESVRLNKLYGGDNKRLVRTLSCLGNVYRGLGAYKKSVEILEESLKLCKKYYPKEHYRIGRVLNSLGNLYRRLGDYKQAKRYLQDSLQIYKKHFPENHINVGLTLAYMGNCFRELGDFEKSRDYLEQSLKIHQKHFEQDHAVMGWILFHLAMTYKALGKEQESHQLFDQVLQIYKKGFREENIETACLLRNIAEVYLEKNLIDEAESLIKRSLNILEPRNHIETYKSLEVLGELYLAKLSITQNVNDKEKLISQALKAFIQALKIIEQPFPEHSFHIQRLQSKIEKTQERIAQHFNSSKKLP